MATVIARPGEAFESLMRRFKKVVEKAGSLADLRKHEYFEKPSIKRKKKHLAAMKRAAKQRQKTGEFQKRSGQNFRFSSDHTQKIPTQQSKGNQTYKQQSNRPGQNNRPNQAPKRRPTENRG